MFILLSFPIFDMERFPRESWDHPSNLFDNVLQKLTAKVRLKLLPQYVACLTGNMTQKPVAHSTSTTEYIQGEVLQVDIKVFADTPKARNNLRAFGNYAQVLTAVDMATGYRFGTLTKSHSSLAIQLEAIRVQACVCSRPCS